MIDQNPPQGTLVEFSLTIQRSLTTERHPLGLSDFCRQKVDWVRPKHGQSNSFLFATCLRKGCRLEGCLGRGGGGSVFTRVKRAIVLSRVTTDAHFVTFE